MKTHSQQGGGRRPRLASVLEHAISDYIRTEMELPGLVSIASVDVATNMQFATIWLSVYGADEEEILEIFAQASGRIRKYLTKQLVSKYIPNLRFKTDPSEAHAENISRKLKELDEYGLIAASQKAKT